MPNTHIPLIAMSGNPKSRLAQAADAHLNIAAAKEVQAGALFAFQQSLENKLLKRHVNGVSRHTE